MAHENADVFGVPARAESQGRESRCEVAVDHRVVDEGSVGRSAHLASIGGNDSFGVEASGFSDGFDAEQGEERLSYVLLNVL